MMRRFLFVHVFVYMIWISTGMAMVTEDDSRTSALTQASVSEQIHQELTRSPSPSTSKKHIELQDVPQIESNMNDSDHKPVGFLNYFIAVHPDLTKKKSPESSTNFSLLFAGETHSSAKTLPQSHSAVDLPCSSENRLDNTSPPHSEAETNEETSLCTHHSDPETPDKNDIFVNKACLKPKHRWCLLGALIPSIAFFGVRHVSHHDQ